jgi:aspartate 1-decarboxylase
MMSQEEAKTFKPIVVHVDQMNKIIEIKDHETHGQTK